MTTHALFAALGQPIGCTYTIATPGVHDATATTARPPRRPPGGEPPA